MQRTRLPTDSFGSRSWSGDEAAALGFTTVFAIEVDTWSIVHVNIAMAASLGGVVLPCPVGVVFSTESSQRLGRIVASGLDVTELWVTDLTVKNWCGQPLRLRSAIEIETANATRYLIVASQDPQHGEGSIDDEDSATHDAVTGLPNRPLLVDRLSQTMVRTKRSGLVTAVFVIELDGLDRDDGDPGTRDHGDENSAGSTVQAGPLQQMAAAARSQLRASDTLARIDGDELIAVCDVYGSHDAQTIAERIYRAITADVDAAEAITATEQGAKPEPGHSPGAGRGASIGVMIAADPNEPADSVITRARDAIHKAKHSRVPNIVLVERQQEVIDMTTRIPLDGANSAGHAHRVAAAAAITSPPASVGALANSVRRVRLPHHTAAITDDTVIDLTEPTPTLPFRVDAPYDPRIVQLDRLGWGPLRPTVDLIASSGPIPIGVSGHVPAIAAREAAHQLIGAAYRVKPGALPFSARVNATILAPFLAELAFEASASELTPNAVGIEIDAHTVRHLAFSDIEHLRALRQQGVAVTIRRLDAPSAHESFLEAAAARVVTIDVADMSRERLAQLVAIASRANVAVIAEGVNGSRDLTTVTQAGCRYAQGDLFRFVRTDHLEALDRRS